VSLTETVISVEGQLARRRRGERDRIVPTKSRTSSGPRGRDPAGAPPVGRDRLRDRRRRGACRRRLHRPFPGRVPDALRQAAPPTSASARTP